MLTILATIAALAAVPSLFVLLLAVATHHAATRAEEREEGESG